ncbi:MAG: hypothetical protein J6W03_02390 [Bacteroidaceae bacterium]|nr:hypothetical protein [Bacteroidaceae bacterium]
MKRLFITFLLAAGFFAIASAQKSLVGRVYHHPNIMAEEMNKKQKEIDSKLDETIKEEVAKAEKKKGRALTAEEQAQVKQKAKEAHEMAEALIKGTKTAVTVTFKSDKEVSMQMKLQMDDEALKNAGISWAKRKAIKAAIALMPTTQKMQYIVKDNLVICIDGKDRDTLTLSEDGKYLYGEMDEKTKFKLTRKQ